MDSFTLTDQEKQLLSKEKAALQIFNQNGEEFLLISAGKKKHFQQYKSPLMKRTVES